MIASKRPFRDAPTIYMLAAGAPQINIYQSMRGFARDLHMLT
jgi:hypothetical protein